LLYEIIKDKQAIARHKNHETKTNVPKKFTVRGRTESSVREQLETVGLESDGVIKSTMGGKKRNRYVSHYPPPNSTLCGHVVSTCTLIFPLRCRSLSRAGEKEALSQPARAPRSESVRGRGTLSSDSVIRGESASEMRGRSVSRDKHHRSQSATRGPTTGTNGSYCHARLTTLHIRRRHSYRTSRNNLDMSLDVISLPQLSLTSPLPLLFLPFLFSGSVAPRQLTDVAKSKRTFERNQFRHAKVKPLSSIQFALQRIYRFFLLFCVSIVV
jgi:hypothetical protein